MHVIHVLRSNITNSLSNKVVPLSECILINVKLNKM